MSEYGLSELMRRMERLIVVSTVTVLDRDAARAKVLWAEGAESDWLPIAQLGSNALKVWFPPEPGTQVVVVSPGGDTTKGVIFPGPFMGAPPAGNFEGTIEGEGDMIASDISLVGHVHGGIRVGPSDTDVPK